MIMVVVHTERVRCAAMAIRPAGAGTRTLQPVAADKRWKWNNHRGRVACPVQAKVDVILRSSAAAPSAAPTRTTRTAEGHKAGAAARTKVVNYPEVDRVAGAAARSNVMKILRRGIQVRQRNESEQGLCGCIEERGIDYVELPVALKLLFSRGIEDLYRTAILIRCSGKISGTFGERGHGGKRVVRRAAAAAVPAGEEKPLVAAVKNLGDVQRATKESAKT